MFKELTFYPEPERTRDLVYTEYASGGRSLHVLLQQGPAEGPGDGPGIQREFLLKIYREIVARYQSTRRLETPTAFLRELGGSIEALAGEWSLDVSALQGTGFYVFIGGPDAGLLMMGRQGSVYVHVEGELHPLGESEDGGVARVWTDEGTLQEDLFPSSVKDHFVLFKLDPGRLAGRDIVLGCAEGDGSAVLEVLSTPGAFQSDLRREAVTSRFISKKILVVRVPASGFAVEGVRAVKRAKAPRARLRRRLVVAGGAAAFTAAAGLWMFGGAGSDSGRSSRSTAASVSPGEPEIMERGGDAPQAGQPKTAAEEPREPADRRGLASVWDQRFGDAVTSSPVLIEGAVLVGCRDGSVYALERETGKVRWRLRSEHGFGASPAVSGDVALVADYGGTVYALRIRDGSVKWKRKLPARVVSSPAIWKDRGVVGCYDGTAYCLEMRDGSVAWKRPTGGRIRGDSEAGDGVFFVPSYDGHLYAFDPEDGRTRWRAAIKGNIAGAPSVHDGLVAVGSPTGTVYGLDAATGRTRWSFATGGPVKSTPAISSGRVYAGSNDGFVYCLDAAAGTLIWKFKTGDIVLSRPVENDGRLFVGSYDGSLYCLDAASGDLLDRYETRGAIYSSPVNDENSIFFGNNGGRFICLQYRPEGAS